MSDGRTDGFDNCPSAEMRPDGIVSSQMPVAGKGLNGQSRTRGRTAIVTTTINVPTLLRDYARNINQHGHTSVEMIVVLDKKTPTEAESFCNKVSTEYAIPITCLTVKHQKNYLSSFIDFERIIPWNSIQRRNVGYLYALDHGFDFVVTIDDDNFLDSDEDFITSHIEGLGLRSVCPAVTSSTGWFNCIDLMQTNFGHVFPRGFPLSKRWLEEIVRYENSELRCVVNAGLWVGDPDVDALTRIYYPVETSRPLKHERVALEAGTWCPVNSQNTAFTRDAMTAGFLIVMGADVGGIQITRYDDIWMGWILQSIANHMGDSVRYGRPVVRQNRNVHNLFVDLKHEIPGMELNEEFISACQSCEYKSNSYLDAYWELACHISDSLAKHKFASFFEQVSYQMKTWASAAQKAVDRSRANMPLMEMTNG